MCYRIYWLIGVLSYRIYNGIDTDFYSTCFITIVSKKVEMTLRPQKYKYVKLEELEDTKGVIRTLKWKKNRQRNGQIIPKMILKTMWHFVYFKWSLFNFLLQQWFFIFRRYWRIQKGWNRVILMMVFGKNYLKNP